MVEVHSPVMFTVLADENLAMAQLCGNVLTQCFWLNAIWKTIFVLTHDKMKKQFGPNNKVLQ
jgi:hypothetical protein